MTTRAAWLAADPKAVRSLAAAVEAPDRMRWVVTVLVAAMKGSEDHDCPATLLEGLVDAGMRRPGCRDLRPLREEIQREAVRVHREHGDPRCVALLTLAGSDAAVLSASRDTDALTDDVVTLVRDAASVAQLTQSKDDLQTLWAAVSGQLCNSRLARPPNSRNTSCLPFVNPARHAPDVVTVVLAPPAQRLLAVMALVIGFVVVTADPHRYDLWLAMRDALAVGVACGCAYALSDIALLVRPDVLELRDWLLVRRIPWTMIESIGGNEVSDNVRLRVRGRQKSIGVAASTPSTIFSRRPGAVAELIQNEVELAGSRANALASSDTSLKPSVLPSIVLSAGGFAAYAALLHVLVR